MNIDESREQPYEGSPLQASDRLRARIAALEAEAKDARYLIASFIKAAGGRVELSIFDADIGPKDQITNWDEPITGKRVYTLVQISTSQETSGEHEPICSCGLTVKQKAQCHCGGWKEFEAKTKGEQT